MADKEDSLEAELQRYRELKTRLRLNKEETVPEDPPTPTAAELNAYRAGLKAVRQRDAEEERAEAARRSERLGVLLGLEEDGVGVACEQEWQDAWGQVQANRVHMAQLHVDTLETDEEEGRVALELQWTSDTTSTISTLLSRCNHEEHTRNWYQIWMKGWDLRKSNLEMK